MKNGIPEFTNEKFFLIVDGKITQCTLKEFSRGYIEKENREYPFSYVDGSGITG